MCLHAGALWYYTFKNAYLILFSGNLFVNLVAQLSLNCFLILATVIQREREIILLIVSNSHCATNLQNQPASSH